MSEAGPAHPPDGSEQGSDQGSEHGQGQGQEHEARDQDDLTTWQRLDPRMLVIGPISALREFIVPLVFAAIGLGAASGGVQPWVLIGLLAPIVVGVVPWFTTRYRITATQFELHKGIVSKRRLTAPLDRIRSVDLESSLLHRALGLAKVKVGTGVDDGSIELNAISVHQADELRLVLLRRRDEVAADEGPVAAPGADAPSPTTEAAAPGRQATLARIDWSWLRFAPLSLSRLAIVAAMFGVVFQVGNEANLLSAGTVDGAIDWLRSFTVWLLVAVALVAIVVGWLVISVGGYALQWFGFRLTREEGTIRLTAGALTTRSTTLEERRIRGAQLTEPVLLRLASGAELAALATGVDDGVSKVLPQCPITVARGVSAALLEDPEPMTRELTEHGPLARRRCHIRHQLDSLITAVAIVAPTLIWDWPWWPTYVAVPLVVAFAVLCAEAEYRHLGHTLTERHLVAGSGVLTRRRTALERDGIIGWVIHQTWFQRRRGLADLIATTAAGDEKVVVADVALPVALALAEDTTPGLWAPFLDTAGTAAEATASEPS